MPETIAQVDHLQRVLMHFDDDRLIETTRDYLWRAFAGPLSDRDLFIGHAESCRAECQRRGISVPDYSSVNSGI